MNHLVERIRRIDSEITDSSAACEKLAMHAAIYLPQATIAAVNDLTASYASVDNHLETLNDPTLHDPVLSDHPNHWHEPESDEDHRYGTTLQQYLNIAEEHLRLVTQALKAEVDPMQQLSG